MCSVECASGEIPTASAAPALDTGEAHAAGRLARAWPWVGALAGYLLLTLLLFLPAWLAPARRTVGGGGDPVFFTWFLGWFPYAVGHGLNPLFTTHLDYPGGVNLMWNTSIPLPSLLVSPVTLGAGPLVAYNLLATLGPALSGWCACLAFRRYVRGWAAAFVGGTVYAFSPFEIGQSLGHPHLTMAWAPPLVLLLLDELIVRRRPTLQKGALLGALGAAQLLTGEEVLAITAVAALLGLAILAVWHHTRAWSHLRPAFPALGMAAATFLALCGLPLAFQFFGPQQVHGDLQPDNYYVSDLLNFLVPTRLQLLAPALATYISDHFSGDPSQRTAYVGAPLIAFLVAWVPRHWQLPPVRLATALAGALAVLSLGDTLHVAGLDSGIPLPWAVMDRVPLMHDILPARFSVVIFLLVGLLLSLALDSPLPAPRWRSRSTLVGATALGLLALFPALPYPTSAVPQPGFFSHPAAPHALPEGSVILVAPFAVVGSAEAMYWQASAGMWFRMPEGDAFVPSPNPLYPPPSATEYALVGIAWDRAPATQPDPAVVSRMRAELRRWNVQAVVLGPMPHRERALALLQAVLGRTPVAADGVDVWWDVPADLAQMTRYSLDPAPPSAYATRAESSGSSGS